MKRLKGREEEKENELTEKVQPVLYVLSGNIGVKIRHYSHDNHQCGCVLKIFRSFHKNSCYFMYIKGLNFSKDWYKIVSNT